MKIQTIITVIALLGLLFLLPKATPSVAAEDGLTKTGIIEAGLREDKAYLPARVPPPDPKDYPNATVQSMPMAINFNPGSCPNPVNAWPASAQTTVQYAASIWALVLNGTQTIVVDACWEVGPLPNFLAFAGPLNNYSDFSGAPMANTRYPVALANQLSDSDLNGTTAEIRIRIDSSDNWYLGQDGNPPAGQFDLVTVALHEIGHGLGFAASFNWDDGNNSNTECNDIVGTGCWGSPPRIYDRFVITGGGQLLLNAFTSPSLALGTQLTTNNNFFNGPTATNANGGNWPRLFSPATWAGPSSIIHLDENTFNNTPHALMTPALNNGESAHHPGTVALGILADLGWDVPNLANIYVDLNASGFEDGTAANPFDTVIEGVTAVPDVGTVWIAGGSYNETIEIYRPMTLRANTGVVTIGE